ncbi:hypothetical protein LIER_08226 [Lithospermum erythrorhizon]|uniref:Uncharacterized protein n=1 Tax=Lithospermum erythrorhizon TaxID=34254 RepID=A0AAV3PB72_LITER
MDDQFDTCEFWLPQEFLNDEDFALDLKKSGVDKEVKKCGSDSEMGSNESESDEDEYIITRKMDNSNVQHNKACRLPTSPKSPLCKAAGEFGRRKIVQESARLLQSRNEVFAPVEQPGPKFGYPTNHPPQSSYHQFHAVRFEQIQRRQMINQAQQNIGMKNGEKMPIDLPYPARPPLQRSHPGGMRAVFSGNSLGGAKKQCAGTGVFLPRTLSSTENCINKPASIPVLIPDGVVQALNLNLEKLAFHNQAPHHPGYSKNNGLSADNGAALNYNNNIKKTHVNAQQPQSIARLEPENPEVIRLPPEWTY